MSGWHPIETGPRSGGFVLLHAAEGMGDFEGDYPKTFVGRWNFALKAWQEPWGEIFPATHWMPLPLPPLDIPEQIAQA